MKSKTLTTMEGIKMKVTEKMLDRELFTFCSRTEKQLIIRTRMLFDPVKLEACRTMAVWCDVKPVEELASKKLNVMVQ